MKRKKSLILLLALIMVLSIFAAACGKSDTGTQGSTPSGQTGGTGGQTGGDTSGSDNGNAGGTLIFGRGADSVSLDPAIVTDGESLRVTKNIFDTLLDYEDDSMIVIPALAEEWKISDDGLTYTFSLRQGVKFHDGTPFNAEAVKFNFDRWKNPDNSPNGVFEYYTSQFGEVIKEVVAVDEHTVEFHLNRTQGPFLQNIAMSSFGIASPTAVEKYGSQFGQNPVGTGPFIFKDWKPKESITIDKNPEYWMTGYPLLDKVVFRSIDDNSARLNALLAGDIDIMDNLGPSDVESVEKSDKLEIIMRPSFNVAYLGFNTENEKLKDPKVRIAIAHAINKQGLVETIFSGRAVPAKNPMPPTLWGYNDDIQDYPFDLDKAKQLLAEAGYPNGLELTFHAMPAVRPYMPNGPKAAEAMAADLAKIGIKTEIVSPEWSVYLEDTKVGNMELFILGWTGDNGDPDNFIYALLDQDNIGGNNRARYKNQELHDLLIAAQSESDQSKRAEMYKDAQVIIHEDQPWVPLVHADPPLASNKNVKGFTPHPGGSDKLTKTYFDK